MKKSLSLKGVAVIAGIALLTMGFYRMDVLGIRSKIVDPTFPVK